MSHSIQYNDHVCCMYQDHDEHVHMVCQFCNEGLMSNNKVLCLLADEQMVASVLQNETYKNYKVVRSSDVIDKLRESGCDVDSFLSKGQLEFRYPSSFMHNDELQLDKLMDHLAQEAKANKPNNVWLYSDPLFYILTYGRNSQGTISFHDFESKLNKFSQCMILCCYDKRMFSVPFLQQTFATHPIIASDNNYYTTNIYYMPDYDPSDSLHPHPFSSNSDSLPAVDRWISFLDEWQKVQKGKEKKHRKKLDEHSGLESSFISNMRWNNKIGSLKQDHL